MIRQELLVLMLMVAGLSGCCLSASHQSSGCQSCGNTNATSCNTTCSHGKSKCGCRSGMSCGRTAPLFPGDTYGQTSDHSSCSDGSCGAGGCSTCGESMSSMPMNMGGAMPEPMNAGCGCGQQSTSMMPTQQFPAQFSAPPVQSQRSTPPTGNTEAPNAPPERGMPPTPADPAQESDPAFPINVDPAEEGAPAAAPVVDPISWEIPAIPQTATLQSQSK